LRALLDLLSTHSERLKEQYPDIHALLRQVRPYRDDWKQRSSYNKFSLMTDDTPSSKEMKSLGKDYPQRSLLTQHEDDSTDEDNSSNSSSGFF